jgi:hypothetical protein
MKQKIAKPKVKESFNSNMKNNNYDLERLMIEGVESIYDIFD